MDWQATEYSLRPGDTRRLQPFASCIQVDLLGNLSFLGRLIAQASGFLFKQSGIRAEDGRLQPHAQRQQATQRLKPLQRDLARAEQALEKLQTEKAALEERMGQTLPVAELVELGQQHQALLAALEKAEGQWLDLTSEIEALALN